MIINYGRKSKYLVLVILIGASFSGSQVQGALLLQTGQYVFYGDDDGVNLGYAVKGVGDVNNDGFDDYAMSAPGHNYLSEQQRGAVYLFYGEEDANMIDLTIDSADIVFYGETEFDQAGIILEPAGDVNGDNFDDFMIGTGNTSDWKVYLVIGQRTRKKINDLSEVSISFSGEQNGSLLVDNRWPKQGVLAGIGDIDNDGYDDIAIGDTEYDVNATDVQSNNGKLYIFYGSSSISGHMNASEADFAFHGGSKLDKLGSVAGLGDINADGLDDYAIGAPGYKSLNGTYGGYGALYIMYGGYVRRSGVYNINEANFAALFLGDKPGSEFGLSIFSIGDHNGNGRIDFAVSSYSDFSNQGSLYVFFNKDFSGILHAGDAEREFRSSENGHFGEKAAKIADLNGDGFPELAISDSAFNDNSGRIYIFEGSNARGTYQESDASIIIDWDGGSSDMYLGVDMANVGDVNRDGMDDLIIGAPGYSDTTDNGNGAVILLTKMFVNQEFTETISVLYVEYYFPEKEIAILPTLVISVFFGILFAAIKMSLLRRKKIA